jgi:hypothetical protein
VPAHAVIENSSATTRSMVMIFFMCRILLLKM